ncbi:hypothetical protein [Comamonas flocculans]|uniref:Uncharacterized protein n=1 Tax=Comamonas flocculans TaxID=2597701 RepID=A0A5B8RWL6_9BURK|nr:hypothetical protein [Comamonas flocculans]QEA13910.1 hypothetical protein FOZ74_13225 [Comamonas flocculans]
MSSDLLLWLALGAAALFIVNARQQRERVLLLAQALQPYQVERLMQALIEGYLRAMGEHDAARRSQVLATLQASEAQLCEQLQRLAQDAQRMPAAQARISRLAFGLPWSAQLPPALAFDLRHALALHAGGIARAIGNGAGLSERDRAYMVTAELLLLQHTCHWYCKSRNVASARLLARHRTAWAQVIAAVGEPTRRAYLALITGQASTGR